MKVEQALFHGLDKQKRRSATVSIRVRNHVNPLSAKFIELRGELPDLPTGRPIELEIGCADAQFLFEVFHCNTHRRLAAKQRFGSGMKAALLNHSA